LALDVRGKRCLVVGGGSVATRKVRTLAQAGAAVTVVSPKLTEELVGQVRAGHIDWIEDSFREEHLDGTLLAVAATDDDSLNATIVRLGAQGEVLVCDASSAERTEVIFPALHQAEDVTIAVFTDGRDPARARKTRDRIADHLARRDG
jgi:siroheme synthase-like protein